MSERSRMLGRIREERVDVRDQHKEMQKAIAASEQLQAIIRSLNNKYLTAEVLAELTKTWNESHPPIDGAYEEMEFDGESGLRLIVRMGWDRNIQIESAVK